MSKPINVNGNIEFTNEVINSAIPVLVDFWAPWCGPCQMMSPVLESFSEEMENKIKVVKVDTEESENQKLALDFRIQSIPNMKIFVNGKVVKDIIGYRPKESLIEETKEFILG